MLTVSMTVFKSESCDSPGTFAFCPELSQQSVGRRRLCKSSQTLHLVFIARVTWVDCIFLSWKIRKFLIIKL